MKLRLPFISIFSVTITLLATLSSTMVLASADHADNTAAKRKVISRLYEITTSYKENCRRVEPAAAAEFKLELDRFTAANKKLLKLMADSPLYADVVRQSAERAAREKEATASPASAGDCQYLSSLLRAMTNNKDDDAIKQFEAVLAD